MSGMSTTSSSTAPRRERRYAELFRALRIPRETQLAPDERHLAYVERRPGTYTFVRTVHVLELAADGAATEIASFPGFAPQWSPDGGTLAYLLPPADALEPGEQGIELWSLEQRSSRTLLDVADVGALAWSPDGARIAFTAVPPSERGPLDPVVVREAGFRVNGSEVPARHAQLYVVDAADDGRPARRLVDLPQRAVGAFAFSPDGARIAFAAGLHFHEPSHLHLVTLDGVLERLGPEEGECVSVA
jgi:dipeptidyl aminopeptidase/acylaminoacyl peptidase